jgi:hypothetical protein
MNRQELVEKMEIPLTCGQVAIVDAADYEWLMQWKWLASWSEKTQSFYAKRSDRVGSGRIYYSMHRVILGLVQGDTRKGDHENHDTLDNRRSNLRIATSAQNCQNMDRARPNRSGYKGVCWHGKSKMYVARLYINGRAKYLGYFHDPAEAHMAYQAAATEHFGEFASFCSSREERRQSC